MIGQSQPIDTFAAVACLAEFLPQEKLEWLRDCSPEELDAEMNLLRLLAYESCIYTPDLIYDIVSDDGHEAIWSAPCVVIWLLKFRLQDMPSGIVSVREGVVIALPAPYKEPPASSPPPYYINYWDYNEPC